MKETKTRDQIDNKYKWKLEDIFQTREDWQIAFEKAEAKIASMAEYRGKFTKTGKTLCDCMKAMYELSNDIMKLYVYAYMKRDEDSTNAKSQEIAGKADYIITRFSESVSFFEPELLQLDENRLAAMMKRTTGLKEYAFVIEEIMRKKAHVLSPAEEKILAMSGEATSVGQDVFMMFNNADIQFEPFVDENGNKTELTIGRYVKFLESQDRNLRRRAFRSMYEAYEKHQNTLAATYAGSVKADAFYSRVRKYKSSFLAALYEDNIPSKVYNGLIKSVHDHIALLTRYLQIRQKLLGVMKVHMYDLYVPLVKVPEKNYTFEEAKEIVIEAFKPLGEDYARILKSAFTDGWIDVCENKGKRTGAYSWGCYDSHPYVLLNWQGTINDVFTLAHELGHAMHSYYSNTTQPKQYASYKIFVAEVASTVNENLLMEHMLKNSKDDTERAFLINHYLEEFRTTVYRQTMFAEFEKKAHRLYEKGEVLTSELLSETYLKLQHQYFKKVVKIDDEIAMEWARIPHFYNSYYVYKYATGFSSATHLASGILSGDKEKIEAYMGFLKSGGSDYPMEILKKAGVDLSTTEPIDAAFDVFEEKLTQFEVLML